VKLVIAAPVTSRSGYGDHARDIALALIQMGGYDVKIIPTRWGNTPQNALKANVPGHQMIKERLIPGNLDAQPDIFVHLTIPNEFQPAGKFNIGITAGIETTLCKPEWVEGCNRMDLVITTSRHSAEVFRQSIFEKRDKVTQQVVEAIRLAKPVEVLFEGIDPTVYTGKQSAGSVDLKAYMKSIPEEFCFLFVGHWLQGTMGNDRKDVSMLVRTFMDVFKRKAPRNRPALILKTSMAGFSMVEKDGIVDRIYQIQEMIRGTGWKGELPSVYLLHGELSGEEMNDLYNHPKVKAMVSFTKGEGFGRPLLEFTTTGKPVICSGWSGQLDFLKPDYSVLLPGQVGRVDPSAANEWIMAESEWFTVNYHAAAQILFDVYEHYEKYLERSRKHKKFTIESYTFDKMQQKLRAILDQYLSGTQNGVDSVPKRAEMPKIVLPKLKKVEA
jgi:hypothetical protein